MKPRLPELVSSLNYLKAKLVASIYVQNRQISRSQASQEAQLHVYRNTFSSIVFVWVVLIVTSNGNKYYSKDILNPFVPNAPFLYPWKHQKTVVRFSNVFRGKRKGVLGTNRLNELQSIPVRSQKSIISKFKKEKYTLKSELIELKDKTTLK